MKLPAKSNCTCWDCQWRNDAIDILSKVESYSPELAGELYYEFANISGVDECNWLRSKLELDQASRPDAVPRDPEAERPPLCTGPASGNTA